MPQRNSGVPNNEGRLSAIDAADGVLVAASRNRTAAVMLEPVRGASLLTVVRAGQPRCLAELPSTLGDGTVARLALLADIDLTASGEQLGRIRLRIGQRVSELLVAVQSRPDGLGAEVRRIVSVDDTSISMPPESVRRGFGRIGAYRLCGELGSGGAGIVYQAIHEGLERTVAIKVLHRDKAYRGEHVFRFVREARAASRIRHPAVVEVIDFGALPDDRAFLVMELVQGETLRAQLQQGAFEHLRAVQIAEQVARGLAAAHRAGVIHRDVKPENIFLIQDDMVKIGDFGAAKLTDIESSDTDSGHRLATPCYMSPEVALAHRTDERSDVYSLGCVLFEMLAGQRPFLGQTYFEIMAKHINAPLPKIASQRGQVPEMVERIVRRAMAKRPEDRYQTASEMEAELGRAATSLGRTGWRRWLPT